MEFKKDKTQDKEYQRYVNSNDRKRAKGIVKELRKSPLAFHKKLAADIATNGGVAPAPRSVPNQRQKRKLAAQTR